MESSLEIVRAIWPILAFIAGAFAGLLRMMLNAYSKHVDERFTTIQQMLAAEAGEAGRVRNELQDFKLYVAERYVDRDQWVRIEAGRDITLRQMNKELKDISTELARQSKTR